MCEDIEACHYTRGQGTRHEKGVITNQAPEEYQLCGQKPTSSGLAFRTWSQPKIQPKTRSDLVRCAVIVLDTLWSRRLVIITNMIDNKESFCRLCFADDEQTGSD